MAPKPHFAPADEAVAASQPNGQPASTPTQSEWLAQHELERERAKTERLRILADFLARPIHAHGGSEPDSDIVVAYNLAVEAALQGIRRAALAD